MQNEPVVAETVFPRSCSECFEPLGASFAEQQVCPHCNLPQRLRGESYFVLFQVPLRFRQNQKLLESRFYEVSRVLHPDRFTQAGERARKLSLERMSFFNGAYQALKHPETRRLALIECWGGMQSSEGSMQPEMQAWAEEWFEVQDTQDLIPSFLDRLKQVVQQTAKEIESLEASFDRFEDAQEFKESQVIVKKLIEKIQLDRSLGALMQQCLRKMP
jgi:molecular chaperone HscB